MTTEYHKIETPYKRDMEGTKRLIEGDFRSPYVEYIKDCQWVWKEKIDGTNIRIIWDGHIVWIKGRTDKAQLPMDLIERLNNLFQTPEAEEVFEQLFGEKKVVLYGEGYGAGIQSVGKDYSDHKDFIMFDVMVGDGYYLDVDNGKEIAKAFGVPYVPVLLEGTIDDAVTFVKSQPQSLVADNKSLTIEGVVGAPKVPLKDVNGNRLVVKVKVRDFCIGDEQ